ncbi:MAG: MMPL family transporter [Chloroflexi bacterium]|nr:MMPL family transporter [Chloroflexota bacterium]
MTSRQTKSGPADRFADFAVGNSRKLIGGVLILTLLLLIPFYTMAPEGEASQNPSGQVFDLQDDVDERFESEIHASGWLFESRTGDILTRDGLLEVLTNSQLLREADERGELAPEGLPVQPYLIRRFDPETNRTVYGIDSLADAVDEVFRAVPQLPENLAAATDEQVKFVIYQLFTNPASTGLRESLSIQATSEKRTVFGQEIDWWVSPAFITFTISDNLKLGGGTQQIGLGADQTVLDKEAFNRNIQELLRGDELKYQAWGIAIDVSLESEDEGSIAGIFIMFTVIAAVIVVGVALRSYWSMVLTGVGLAILMIWLKGISNLIQLEGGLIIEFIVPVAMISLGVDFSVHALKRYEEESRPGIGPRRALVIGLSGVTGALALAMASDSLAFLANVSSGIDGVIQFGVAAAIAVASSFIVLGVIVPLSMMEIQQIIGTRATPSGRLRSMLNMGKGFTVALLAGTSVVFIVAAGAAPPGMEVGILILTIVAYLAVPLWFAARKRDTTQEDEKSQGQVTDDDPAETSGGPLVTFVTTLADWRYAVIPVSLAITAIAVVFAMKLEATFDVKDFFASDSDFVVSLDKLDEHVAERDGEPAIIYLQGDFTDPAAILATDRFINSLADNPYVARESNGEPNLYESIITISRRLTENDFARGQVEASTGVPVIDANGDGFPDTRESQTAVLAYAVANGVPLDSETLALTASQVTEVVDFKKPEEITTILVVGIPGTRRQEVVKAAADRLEIDLVQLRAEPTISFASFTGSPFARQAQLEATTKTLQRSIPIAAAGALILLLLVMRSVRYAVVTVIPIGLVVAWLYAIMYLGGFAFNFVTATIGAISIGVGIDFSIHMTERFREELRRSSSRSEALAKATKGTGIALAASATSSIVGFAILGFAPMPLFSSYGFLTAIMIALALIASLVVLPSLLMIVAGEPSLEQAEAAQPTSK